ncbi:hypothetical protein HHK36_028169 [Tetracentron sinense]|uniref:Ninja-family protein n=1 Tax=Tetracentron sinense TaxID=13715 RepID=A0A834YIY8_TETSI|nr:hypothetical protein HHK36_028169 [Tetracentron sinense]
MGDAKEDVVEQMIGFPRDLLQRFTAGNHRPNEFASTSEDNEEIELNLGLSLGGCFGVDPEEKKKLIRSSSIAGFMITPVREDDGSAPLPIGSPAIMRPSSLPTEIEEEQRKRKEMQTLRRMEAKRKRSEKQRNLFWNTAINWLGRLEKTVSLAWFSAYIYHIWAERNRRIHQHGSSPPMAITRLIREDVRVKLEGGTSEVKDNAQTREVVEQWGIHVTCRYHPTIELKVEMVGFHYEKRIKKCLSKLRGVEKVEVEFSKKKVVVRGEAGERRVVKALRRSGFRSEPWCSKTEMLLAYFSSSHKPLLRL